MSSSFEMKAAPQCFLQNSFLLDTIRTEFAESHPDVLNNSAATPSCSHPIKQPSHCTAIPSYSHLIPQPFCPVATPVLQVTQCTTTPLHNHPIMLQPFHHTATPSHSHPITQPSHCTVTPSLSWVLLALTAASPPWQQSSALQQPPAHRMAAPQHRAGSLFEGQCPH